MLRNIRTFNKFVKFYHTNFLIFPFEKIYILIFSRKYNYFCIATKFNFIITKYRFYFYTKSNYRKFAARLVAADWQA